MKSIDNLPLGWRHIWIVSVASLGQMVGTAVATLASVIIPMIQIVGHPELASWQQGLLGAADLIGIAVGSVVIGNLSDRYGYLLFFRLSPFVILISAICGILFPNVWLTFIWLFIMGFAIGGEYSLDSDYISELMPDKWRSTMVGVAKTASAFGNIIVAGIAYLLIRHWTEADRWPWLMWIIVVISLVMILSRIHFAPSPKWLLDHGKIKEAQRSVTFFLGKDVTIPEEKIQDAEKNQLSKKTNSNNADSTENISTIAFIRKNIAKVILTGVPWACEGLGVYGIGVFLPILLIALGIVHQSAETTPIIHVAMSVKVTFWISCLILPGFIIGLFLIRRMNSIRQLASGFYLSALSVGLLLVAYHFHWAPWISIAAFMGFELFLNCGPHLITYVLPPEVFDVKERSMGSGLAASQGKIGAVLAVFFIPVILKSGGISMVLLVSLVVMLVGGLVTSLLGPKVMKGVKG